MKPHTSKMNTAEKIEMIRKICDSTKHTDPLKAIMWTLREGEATTGADLIAAERERQITVEKWTPEHDAEFTDGALAEAAGSYLITASAQVRGNCGAKLMDDQWPWIAEWWKPSDDPVRNLAKAGALIAAEIDRINGRKDQDKECP